MACTINKLARVSASDCARKPAKVAGAVAPACAAVMQEIGILCLTRIIHDGAVFCWQRWRKCLIQRIERVYNQSRAPDNDCQRRHE